ncbi:outer membrane lipoprotein-sorting protein [Croceiramulus getboli]|nr:outer membrane lipoprotein-sorting protein [Flavobacteriaceae bacterium YJPT1-3]
MKIIKGLCIAALLIAAAPLQAQTADEIISNYLENTGGEEAWAELEGVKMSAKAKAQGGEFPVTVYTMTDGRTATIIDIQGQTLKQQMFDGEVLWSTNFQTGVAEKADDESTANMKINSQDFPDPFVNYKEKGYKVELIGSETVEGTDTYKIKLMRKPMMAEGKEVDNVTYYYFEKENFVPIVTETEVMSGPGKGMVSQTKMSDYQEVDGLYFPFSMAFGVKGMPGQEIAIDSIELNPEVEDEVFEFPGGN